jgi:excisionase family DNA binding protein
MTNLTSDRLLSIDEVAALLRVHRRTLLNWADNRVGPRRFNIAGRRWWYRESEVERFVNERYRDACQYYDEPVVRQ